MTVYVCRDCKKEKPDVHFARWRDIVGLGEEARYKTQGARPECKDCHNRKAKIHKYKKKNIGYNFGHSSLIHV